MTSLVSPKRVLVLGSINIDEVFSVPRFVAPGETVASTRYERHIGGKGDNQAVALARAGAPVSLAGKVGEDGHFILESLDRAGVDRSRVFISKEATGRAIIQVREDGQNCILLALGANLDVRPADIDAAFDGLDPGDMVVFQNEISSMDYAFRAAARKGFVVVFNPSPITADLASLPIDLASWLILNETEGRALVGEAGPAETVAALAAAYPGLSIVLTLGSEGSLYRGRDGTVITQPVFKVQAVDTTAAGDTFTGYLLAGILDGLDIRSCLRRAACAAAICVGRPGAQPAIPMRAEVDAWLDLEA